MAVTLGACGADSPGTASVAPTTVASGNIVGPCVDPAMTTTPGTHLVALLALSADGTLTYSMTHHVKLPGTQGAQEPCGPRMTAPVSEHVVITAEHGTICNDQPRVSGPCTLDRMKIDANRWNSVTPVAYIRVDAGRVVEIEEVYNG
ncbi:hypothetical protein ACFYUD_36320 [Nocardia tengchongensis]|uniref:hypothetical protein n=1 Tax=Nocardia tengchongensis TaxID=2055889 RepID=UPI00368EB756